MPRFSQEFDSPIPLQTFAWLAQGESVCFTRRGSAVRNRDQVPKIMKLFEATIRVNGREFKDRVGAENAQEAMKLLQQRHGPRAVPYVPHMIPS